MTEGNPDAGVQAAASRRARPAPSPARAKRTVTRLSTPPPLLLTGPPLHPATGHPPILPTGPRTHRPGTATRFASECLPTYTRSRILACGYTPPDRQLA